MYKVGKWQLAPAYDLTFSYSSHGMHSTMVAGESRAPGKRHLLELAKYFSVKKPDEIIDRVQDVVFSWDKYANENRVGSESTNLIKKAISKKKSEI